MFGLLRLWHRPGHRSSDEWGSHKGRGEAWPEFCVKIFFPQGVALKFDQRHLSMLRQNLSLLYRAGHALCRLRHRPGHWSPGERGSGRCQGKAWPGVWLRGGGQSGHSSGAPEARIRHERQGAAAIPPGHWVTWVVENGSISVQTCAGNARGDSEAGRFHD